MNCKKNDCFTCPYPDCINDYVKKRYKRPPDYSKINVIRNRERQEKRAAAGLCIMCGRKPPRAGYKMCPECQAKTRNRQNRYNWETGKRQPQVLLDGVSRCKRCGKAPPAEGYKLCERCLESARRALDTVPSHNGKAIDNYLARALRADAERMKAKK